jgi:peptidoglycan biosynthesis protein MviN/MurJ (putative lipid II flippase)
VWPLAEGGLAATTSLSITLQCVILAVLFSRRHVPLDWSALTLTLTKTAAASLGMAIVVVALLHGPPAGWLSQSRLLSVAIPGVGGLAAYLALAELLRQSEWRMILGRGPK